MSAFLRPKIDPKNRPPCPLKNDPKNRPPCPLKIRFKINLIFPPTPEKCLLPPHLLLLYRDIIYTYGQGSNK
nr:MAG TPA: hypothetical protein [Caudoviricetes sp.]